MKETQNLGLHLISSSESDVNIHDYIDKTTGDSPDSSLAKIDAAFGTVVLKEEGKGLSPEEFTQEEKAKLANVAEEANKTIVDSALSPTSENPVQNKVVQKALEEKADLGTDGKVLKEQLPDLNYDPVGSAGAVQGNLNAHTGDGDKHFTPGEKEKLSTAAPLDSPSFTGTPTVPSPAVADNSTAIASTAFVKGQGYQTEEQVRGIAEASGVDKAELQAIKDALYANVTDHPFLITFENLDGINLEKGIWNAELGRLEW